MSIEIYPLTPDLADDYARFFDVTPHDVDHGEMKCYCVTWRDDKSYKDAGHWFETREERRAKAIEYVKNGNIRGYLAYDGDEIIGWCNSNENCSLCRDYLRGYYPIEHEPSYVKIKPIFCFVVKPEYQRTGVATALVCRVCEDAAKDGFDFVEAYENECFISASEDFRGPIKMYENCGFVKTGSSDGRAVMRKRLKE
ncbi:MAG: GNAT family N-acetyltransferase [Clostridiales bacterium]|nr:GNAT family N-acetyltransferase [Clostridiales bacterium]